MEDFHGSSENTELHTAGKQIPQRGILQMVSFKTQIPLPEVWKYSLFIKRPSANHRNMFKNKVNTAALAIKGKLHSVPSTSA